MKNLQDLIRYLKPERERLEEIENREYDPLVVIDENYDIIDPFKPSNLTQVLRTDLENSLTYAKISIPIVDDSLVVFYDIAANLYYTKRTYDDTDGNQIVEFKKILPEGNNPPWEELDESSLTVIEIAVGFGFYFNRDDDKIYQEPLDEINLDNEFKYNPKNFEPLEDGGVYELNYKDYEGYYNDFGDQLLKTILDFSLFKTLNSIDKRRVTLNLNDRVGLAIQFPRIRSNYANTKIIVRFPFSERKRFLLFFLVSRTALRLEFKSIYTYLAFVNATFFEDGDSTEQDYFEVGNPAMKAFHEDYLELLDREFRRRRNNVTEILRLILFTPPVYLYRKDKEILWGILKQALRNSVTNAGTNKEDAVVKIIKVLTIMEAPDDFLNALFERKVGGRSFFYLLYDKINGKNFDSYVAMVHSIWLKSSYPFNIDNERFASTDGPIFLGYTSQKSLGFFYSNCDIDYDKKKDLLEFSKETGEYTYEYRYRGRRKQKVKKEIILDYKYHPLYPIIIPNFEEQKTEIKLQYVVPAFYLKANEDRTFWSNVLTVGEYAVDVATTVSGVGNIYKFRHLAKIAARASKLKNARRAGQFANAASKVRLAAGIIEISSGTVNTLLKLLELKDSPLGKEIGELLFWLEMASLSGELRQGVKNGLRKSSFNLLAKKDTLDAFVRKGLLTLEKQKELIDDIVLMLLDKVETVFLKFKATIELLENFKVTITRNIDNLRSSPQIQALTPNGARYHVNYNSSRILEGTQDDINNFLKQIEDISKSGGNYRKKIKSKLDELADEVDAKYRDFLRENDLVIQKSSDKVNAKNLDIIDTKTGKAIVRGSKLDLEKVIYFLKLDPQEKQKLLTKVNKILQTDPKVKNRGYLKTADAQSKIPEKLRKAGVNQTIPKVEGGAGVCPDLSVLGENMFSTKGRLGKGDYQKLYDAGVSDEQIKDFLAKVREFKGQVRTNVTGNRSVDFNNCWIEMGINPELGNKIYKNIDITWHHLDDLDKNLKSGFQLVVSDIHKATYSHMGSDKQIRTLLEIIKIK